MPLTARSRDEIRDALLATWSTRYRARGDELATDRDSHAFAEAESIASVLEALEITAQANALAVLIGRAHGRALDRFAEDDGTARKAATTARRHVAVTGPLSTTTALSGEYFTSSSGQRFNPIASDGSALTSITTDGSGTATILVECSVVGILGNVATGATLTWSSPPSGFASTAAVSATTTNRRDGTAQERDADLKLRLLDRRRERPASGNRSDWREKVREVSEVADAFVYPLARPPASYPGASTPQKIGCVTVLAVGAARTNIDSPTDTRFAVGGAASAGLRCTQLEDFVEGDRDATLAETSLGTQWRPVAMPQDNYCIKTPRQQTQNVEVRIKLGASRPFAWTYDATFEVYSTSTSTSLVVNGDHTAKAGKAALVCVGASLVSGGYKQVTLPSGSYNGGTGRTTFDLTATPLGGAPVTSSTVLPSFPDWVAAKTSIVQYFDGLGPGEYTGSPTESLRFPPPEQTAPSTLYPSALCAKLISDVPAVLSAVAGSPLTGVTPVDEYMLSLGLLVVREDL